jgi:hypothetical protein
MITDPALSVALLGAPILDVYGDATMINGGIDRSGNGNHFSVVGAVNDI